MEELIEKAQKGDKLAFTKIVLTYKEDLYKIAKTRLDNEADIEDMIQETMLETYKSIRKLKEPAKLKKWMIKILVNRCNKLYRKKYKNDISIDEYNMYNYMIVNSSKNFENDIEFYELLKILKYKERIILLLYYMEGYTVKEIKNITGINENTIYTNLSRAREKIRKQYEKGGSAICKK